MKLTFLIKPFFYITKKSEQKYKYLPKITYSGIFDSNFEKLLSYLKSAPSNLSYCKVWCKKKLLKFGTKNVEFRYFRAGVWKYYYNNWNQCSRIFLIEKFGAKIKSLNLGPKMLYLGVFELDFENDVAIFEINELKPV